MPIDISLDILDGKTPINSLRQWLTFPTNKGECEFLIGIYDAETQETDAKDKGVVVPASRWLSFVHDWRGIVDKGEPIPFSRERLNVLWRADAMFRIWLTRECQRFSHFRRPGEPAPAG